jgi:hypothetical protein
MTTHKVRVSRPWKAQATGCLARFRYDIQMDLERQSTPVVRWIFFGISFLRQMSAFDTSMKYAFYRIQTRTKNSSRRPRRENLGDFGRAESVFWAMSLTSYSSSKWYTLYVLMCHFAHTNADRLVPTCCPPRRESTQNVAGIWISTFAALIPSSILSVR